MITIKTLAGLVVLSSAWLVAAQRPAPDAPIPCLTDWSRTRIARSAPGLVPGLVKLGKCADARPVMWDELIASLQEGIRVLQRELPQAEASYNQMVRDRRPNEDETTRSIIEGARRSLENAREHLAGATEALVLARAERDSVRRAPASAASAPRAAPASANAIPGDSNTRTLTVPGMVRPDPPAFRPAGEPRPRWVPPSKKRLPHFGVKVGIATSDGPATMTRGGQTIRLVPGQPMDVEAGDIVRTDRGGKVHIAFGEGALNIHENSTFEAGDSCDIVYRESGGSTRSDRGLAIGAALRQPGVLLQGAVNWMTTGRTGIKICRCAVGSRIACACVRGTDFDLTHQEVNGAPVSTLTMKSGSVAMLDFAGNATVVNAGESRAFRETIPPALAPTHPLVRALEGDRPVTEGGRTLVPSGLAAVWLDNASWSLLADDPAQPLTRTFRSADGSVYGRLLTGLWPLEREELRNTALENARAASADARIVQETWRLVKGIHVLDLTIELASGGAPFVLAGRFFTGAQGTAQLTAIAPRAVAAGKAREIAVLFDGLIVANPLSLPQGAGRDR